VRQEWCSSQLELERVGLHLRAGVPAVSRSC
jgi:hypothetical protein